MKFKCLEKSGKSYSIGSLAVLHESLDEDIFDELERRIASVMYNDTFSRYYTSAAYKELKASLEEESHEKHIMDDIYNLV